MTKTKQVPDGFSPLQEGLGFNDAIAPTYLNWTTEKICFGFFVEEQHLNSMKICHGGVLMTFADLAMGGYLGHKIGVMGGMPTINLTIDFLKASQPGDWLQTEPLLVSHTRTLGSVSLLINGPDGPVARVNGMFKIPAAIWEKVNDQ